MDSMLVQLLTNLVGGGAGGAIFGALLKNRSLGPKWNMILGAIGGLVGGQALGATLGGGLAGNLGSSAIGGIVLPLIASFLKKKPATP